MMIRWISLMIALVLSFSVVESAFAHCEKSVECSHETSHSNSEKHEDTSERTCPMDVLHHCCHSHIVIHPVIPFLKNPEGFTFSYIDSPLQISSAPDLEGPFQPPRNI